MSAADRLRINVIGAGAIGGWVAARLSMAGHRVSASDRSGAREWIRLIDQGSEQIVPLEPSIGQPDLVVVAVKAPALAGAAEMVQRSIGADTLILPMLNGVPWWFVPGEPLRSVDPDATIAGALPVEQVIGSVVHAACRRTGAETVEVVHADKLILGEPNGGASERVERIASLFEDAGIRAERSGDVRRAIWYKLWGNATINPLSALTRATADKLLGEPSIRAFMSRGMDELKEVGAAIGCPITESTEDRMAVTARLGSFKTSMLQDVEAGRQIELEALLGAPREIARRNDIPTPHLDLLYDQTRLMAESLSLL